jgi:hypothetical protein
MRKSSLGSWLLAIAVVLGVGCAGERHAVPPAGTLVTPDVKYDLLRGKRIAVRVLDQRSNQELSDALVATVEDAVSSSLRHAGIILDETSSEFLEVRIREFHTELALGEWKGCAALASTLSVADKPEVRAFEQCVTKLDTDGVKSGDQAVAKALEDALALLLHQVDRMGR